MISFIEILKGGRGSGNFGHGGRPGKRGGSGKSRRPKMSNTTVDDEVRENTPYRGNENNNKIIKDIENARTNRSSSFENMLSDVSSRSGVSKDDIMRYVSKWNNAEHFREKELLVKSVNEELGTSLSPYERNKSEFSSKFNSKSQDVREKVETNRKITRAMYEATQERLSELGVDHVIAYRGFAKTSGEENEIVRHNANSVESWSLDQDTAESFAVGSNGVAIKSKIPVNRILSYPGTGAGTANEMEIMVLGNGPDDKVMVIKVADKFGAAFENDSF